MESYPNRSPRAGKENYDGGNSDVQNLFFSGCIHKRLKYLGKNIALNADLRCKRAGFSPQTPMLHEGYTGRRVISSAVEGQR